MRIALQLYTFREYLRRPPEIARTLKRIKKIGYDAVQLSGLGPIDISELTRILDGEGLKACSTHIVFERLFSDLPSVIEEYRVLECTHAAIGGLPADYRNGEGYRRFAVEGTEIGRKFAQAGLTFSYHNHAMEFQKFNGRTGMDILFGESDPAVFFAEIDTYWVQYGGGDPAYWIARMAGRIPLVHFKDMSFEEGQPIMAEVGEGNLNWQAIVAACKNSGVQWCIVEQDKCRRDPFESVAISLQNMKEMDLEC